MQDDITQTDIPTGSIGLTLSSLKRGLAGAAGFEPANGGTKSRCLTTWRRPNIPHRYGPGERALITARALLQSPEKTWGSVLAAGGVETERILSRG